MDVSFDMIFHPGPYSVEERNTGNGWISYIYDANGDYCDWFTGTKEYYQAHLNEEWEKFKKQLEEDDEDS